MRLRGRRGQLRPERGGSQICLKMEGPDRHEPRRGRCPICPGERSSTVLAGTKKTDLTPPPREHIYPLMRLISETCYFAGDFGGISA